MSPSTWLKKLCAHVAIAGIAFLVSFSAAAGPQSIKSSGGRHCLWRVTNAKAPFYLLGSLHILRDTDYPLPGVIEQAIAQSQQFYFEIDPDRMNDFHRKLENASRLPQELRLKTECTRKHGII